MTTLPRPAVAERNSWRSTLFAATSPSEDVRTPLGRWRRTLTWALGLIWLLDAGLQFQSYMFTTDFPKQVIEPTAQGNPGWVHGPVLWAAHLMEHHIVVTNGAFAVVQLLLALGMFFRRTVRPALVASVVWALLVWWLGEGLGGVLAGPVMPIMGFPGAVVLYAFIAVLVWPRGASENGDDAQHSVATSSPLGPWVSRGVWTALWALFVYETLRPANRSASALHDAVAGMASGEPGWLASINHWTASRLGSHGTVAVVVLVVVFAALAVCVYVPSTARIVLIIGVVVSLAIWVAAEDIGEIATGQATDPNSGLLLALLMMCFWPVSRAGSSRP